MKKECEECDRIGQECLFKGFDNWGDDIRTRNEVILCSNGSNSSLLGHRFKKLIVPRLPTREEKREKQLRSRVFLKGPVHELINLEYNCFNAAKLKSVV